MRCSLVAVAGLLAAVRATPLDDYVSTPSPHYKWHDTGAKIKTVFGGTGHVLNVTSQQWLDATRAQGPGGTSPIWTHQVVVVEERHTKVSIESMSFLWLCCFVCVCVCVCGCGESVSVNGDLMRDIRH